MPRAARNHHTKPDAGTQGTTTSNRRKRPRKRSAPARPPDDLPIDATNPTSAHLPSDTAASDSSDDDTSPAAPAHPLSPSYLSSYNPSTGSWAPCNPASLPTSIPLPRELRLLTYNTFSASPTHDVLQSSALLRILRAAQADIIALQEVGTAFWARLCAEEWVKEGWAVSSARAFLEIAGPEEEGGGSRSKEGEPEAVILLVRRKLVCSKAEVGFVKLPNATWEGGKALVTVKLFHKSVEKYRVVTSHFSSLPVNGPLRQKQYRLALALLSAKPISSAAILLADFNASSHAELALFSPFLSDCFAPSPSPFSPFHSSHSASTARSVRGIHPANSEGPLFRASPTFGTLYPFIPNAPRSKPRKPRRIDRVLIGAELECVQYRTVGEEVVRGREGRGKEMRDRMGREGRMWPSDHLGVLVDLKRVG